MNSAGANNERNNLHLLKWQTEKEG